MTLEDLLRQKREILEIAARYGARNVRVFGSVARREPDAQDVDILISLEPGRSILDVGGFLMDLKDLLGCKVDVVTEEGIKPRVRDQVLKEAVTL